MAKKKPVKSVKEDGSGIACAVLGYLLIGIIWYFVDEKMKKDEFARYHVKQAFALWIIIVLVSLVASILRTLLSGALDSIAFSIIGNLIRLLFIAIAIIGIINAATGKKKELPIVGEFAAKLSF